MVHSVKITYCIDIIIIIIIIQNTDRMYAIINLCCQYYQAEGNESGLPNEIDILDILPEFIGYINFMHFSISIFSYSDYLCIVHPSP